MSEVNSNDDGDAFGTTGSGYGENRIIAKMPVERYASEYNMKHKNRGIAIIFNHDNFDIPSLKSRAGTNVDCENLTNSLKQLHFDVIIHKDLKLKEIQHNIDKVARMDHADNDCILISILSHGELGYIYAKDVQYKLESIWSYFTADNCPTLAGKPKLFFIQACQGDRLDGGIHLAKTETDGESSMSYKIPIHADFLIAYSTIPGFYSWRNTTHGSWFMQSLCHELNSHVVVSVLISGYSNLTPSSQVNAGQQNGNEAVLFVLSVSNLHLSLANGNGPQSSTNSNNFGGLSSETTQVERPQNGDKSHVLPGSTVAQRVDAKHIPGKSRRTSAGMSRL